MDAHGNNEKERGRVENMKQGESLFQITDPGK